MKITFISKLFLIQVLLVLSQKLYSQAFFDGAPTWSPDSKKISFKKRDYYEGTSDIFIVNRDGSNLKRLTNRPGKDTTPAWSPDGKWIAFCSDRDGTDDIFIMSVSGNDIKNVTHSSSNDTDCAWSPDGNQLVITSFNEEKGDILIIDLDE